MSVDLNERKRAVLEGGDPAKQRSSGKLLARERIALLLDPNSFVEVGALAGTSGEELNSVIAGYGTIEGRLTYLYAQDFTVKGGAVTKMAADKVVRVMELAAKTGSPVLSLCDSAGARIDQGILSLDAYAGVMAMSARLSGVVPQIALVLGPCAGGAAVIAQLSDFVIQADTGAQFLAGPQVVSAKTGKTYDQKSLGGTKVASETGGAHITCEREEEAILFARKLISMLPSNNAEDAPLFQPDDLNRPINADGSDSRTLIAQLADSGDWLELSPANAPNMTVALAAVGGRTVGIVANNPAFDEGILCPPGCAKAARFVRFCDAFNLPVITIVNTVGAIAPGPERNILAIKAAAQLVYAFAEASVPKVSVITGKAIGIGYGAMASRAIGADIIYAWPDAVISPMSAEASVHIIHREELRAGQSEADLAAAYAARNGALGAAQSGLVDDIVEPAATRQMVICALEAMLGKRDQLPPRKHGNMPL